MSTKNGGSWSVSLVFLAEIKAGPSPFCWAEEELARRKTAVGAINAKVAIVRDKQPRATLPSSNRKRRRIPSNQRPIRSRIIAVGDLVQQKAPLYFYDI